MKYLITLALLGAICACDDAGGPGSVDARTLRIGLLPDQSADALVRRHTPLVEYLRTATGLEIELALSDDYEDFLDDFDEGRVDLAWFGALTFVQAEYRSDAVPLVMRDVDQDFRSCFLVSGSRREGLVADFEGQRFAFGSRLSTSGHLMPRYFLEQDGRVPELFFKSVQYTAGHDQTAYLVRDGIVDLGVANCLIFEQMLEDGRLTDDEVRILGRTPPYHNYAWAARKELPGELEARILGAFLALDQTVSEHAAILRAQNAGGYLPVSRENFYEVREAADSLGLLSDGN
jgi:phosphonate transport system substrate-binding protein